MAELAAWVPLAMNVAGSLFASEGSENSAEGSEKSAAGANAAADAAIVAGTRNRAAAEFKAKQLRDSSGQVFAGAQRTAMNEERKSTLLQSRALALAAASGGGASDPGVVKLISSIAGEGSYRKATALYEGEDRARLLRMQAAASDYEGQVAEEAGQLQAQAYRTQGDAYLSKADAYRTQGTGSLLKGAGSVASTLFGKYGGGGPAGGATEGLTSAAESGFDFYELLAMA